jgi:hypothetical protein
MVILTPAMTSFQWLLSAVYSFYAIRLTNDCFAHHVREFHERDVLFIHRLKDWFFSL